MFSKFVLLISHAQRFKTIAALIFGALLGSEDRSARVNNKGRHQLHVFMMGDARKAQKTFS